MKAIKRIAERDFPWRRLLAGLAAFMVLRHAVTFGSGDVTFTFTLVNRTTHFLHAVINSQSHAYIPPGSSIATQISAYGTAVAEVRYSPGQGLRGEANRVFESQCHTTSTSTASTNTDCNQSSPDCGETTSTGSSSSTTTCLPITWLVVAADLDSTAAGGAR